MAEIDTAGKSIVGKVAAVVNDTTLVLNVGDGQGVVEGTVFSIVDQQQEISDPDSGESLGQWEVVKARVIATHVQERMCTARSPLVQLVDASGTLSTLMVRHSFGLYGQRDEERESLQVQATSMHGRPTSHSIQVGDVVRSVSGEPTPEAESPESGAAPNPTAPDLPSGTYAETPTATAPDTGTESQTPQPAESGSDAEKSTAPEAGGQS